MEEREGRIGSGGVSEKKERLESFVRMEGERQEREWRGN